MQNDKNKEIKTPRHRQKWQANGLFHPWHDLRLGFYSAFRQEPHMQHSL